VVWHLVGYCCKVSYLVGDVIVGLGDSCGGGGIKASSIRAGR
jgi:hypothetical protein